MVVSARNCTRLMTSKRLGFLSIDYRELRRRPDLDRLIVSVNHQPTDWCVIFSGQIPWRSLDRRRLRIFSSTTMSVGVLTSFHTLLLVRSWRRTTCSPSFVPMRLKMLAIECTAKPELLASPAWWPSFQPQIIWMSTTIRQPCWNTRITWWILGNSVRLYLIRELVFLLTHDYRLHTSSLLAAKFHGCLHLVSPFRWWKE